MVWWVGWNRRAAVNPRRTFHTCSLHSPRLCHTTQKIFTGCHFYHRTIADICVYHNLVMNRWSSTAVRVDTESALLPEVSIKTWNLHQRAHLPWQLSAVLFNLSLFWHVAFFTLSGSHTENVDLLPVCSFLTEGRLMEITRHCAPVKSCVLSCPVSWLCCGVGCVFIRIRYSIILYYILHSI